MSEIFRQAINRVNNEDYVNSIMSNINNNVYIKLPMSIAKATCIVHILLVMSEYTFCDIFQCYQNIWRMVQPEFGYIQQDVTRR